LISHFATPTAGPGGPRRVWKGAAGVRGGVYARRPDAPSVLHTQIRRTPSSKDRPMTVNPRSRRVRVRRGRVAAALAGVAAAGAVAGFGAPSAQAAGGLVCELPDAVYVSGGDGAGVRHWLLS